MPDAPKVVDDVQAKPASTAPKSLQNGLGMEALFAGDPPPRPKKEKAVPPAKEKATPEGEPPAETKPDKKVEAKKDDEPTDFETLKKQLKDTRDYATKTNKENKELKQSHASLKAEIDILKAKLDGTYTEPTPPSPEQLQKAESFKARVQVDDKVMRDQYGNETIQQLIWNSDSPYMQLEMADPLIKERIFRAERPVQEAMQVVQEHEFFEKYGRDPEKIKQAILDEAREELVKELKGELKPKTRNDVVTLSGVPAVPRSEQPKVPGAQPLELKSIFTNFPTGYQ